MIGEFLLYLWSIGATISMIFFSWSWLTGKSRKISIPLGLAIALVLSVFWFVTWAVIISRQKETKNKGDLL